MATQSRSRGRAPQPARRPAPRAPRPGAELPRWLAPAVFAFAAVVLFRDFLLGAGILGTDTVALSYFARDFYADFLRAAHRMPLWDPYLFGGLPFVEGMHGDIFYPTSLALLFLDPRAFWGWKLMLHVFLAGVFCYLWLRSLGTGRGPALFGGLAYMMGAQLVSLVFPGGDGKLFVSALAPLVFWLAERAARNRGVADFALFALSLPLMLFSHPQLAYFCVWGVTLYFAFRLWQIWRVERQGRGVARLAGLFALAGLLGVAAAAVQLVPAVDYLRDTSHRAGRTVEARTPAEAYEYSTSWSLHPEEAAALVLPDFVGTSVGTPGNPANTYWGRNPFKLNHEYAGLVPLLLLPLAWRRRRDARAWFFAALGAFALLYALGATTPLFRLFYLIPGVRLFRAPSLIIFLFGLSVVTLGALGLQRLLERSDDAWLGRSIRYLWIAAGALAASALLATAGVITDLWQAILYRDAGPAAAAALEANLPALRAGAWIAAFLAAGVAGAATLYARGVLGASAVVAIIAVIAAVDLLRIDNRFLHATARMNEQLDPVLFEPDDALRFLQAQAAAGPPFRALDVGAYGSSNALGIHGIEQLGGHHGNEIGRYRELIGGEELGNAAASELRLLDVTNTQYLVAPQPIQIPGFQPVYQGARALVYRSDRALPRAYVVGEVRVVPDDAAVQRLLARDFDGRRTVLLPAPLPAGIQVHPGVTGRVEWQQREVDRMRLRVSTDAPALLVVLDNWHEGWHARVDGADAPILRANHTFRAVPVAAGDHTVELFYESPVLSASVAASVLALVLLLGAAIGGTLRRRRRAAEAPPA